ncbi:MAG: hypothetical protein ACPGJS_14670 [Flammeovirgaceae bacterium]
MNIADALLALASKEDAEQLAVYIGDDPTRFNALMDIFFGESYRLNQRAAWVMTHCTKNNQALITPYIERLVHNLKNDVHDAVKRNTVRLLQDYDVPDELLGELADVCFGFLASNKEPIAVKVFSMSVLANIVEKHPELKGELQVLIEDQLPYGSAGFKNRGKKVLEKLRKIEFINND